MAEIDLNLEAPEDKLPIVSVVMPVRNEEDFIERSLRSVLRQSYPHSRIEIIVSDGESTDGTLASIEKLKLESDIPIKVISNPKRIAPSALNRAIEAARGSVIVRVDGHCEIAEDYVKNCVELLRSGKADGVGGPIETIGEGRQAEAIALAMSSKFGVGGSAFRTVSDREMFTDSVAFPGYTKEIIDRAGPYNEELVRNQDDEYNYRIRKLGGKILLSPRIRSKYYSRSTFRSLWRQYFQYGYWKVRVLQLHPRQMSLRQFVPFLFVLTIVLLSLASMFSSASRWFFCITVSAYVLTNLASSIYVAGRRVTSIPYLALSFGILHFSYGLGSIIGSIAFWKRWGEAATPIIDESDANDAPARG